jgi:hypothetical protein
MLRGHVAAPSGAAASAPFPRPTNAGWKGSATGLEGRISAMPPLQLHRGCTGRGYLSCSATKEMEVAHVTDSGAARAEPTLGERLRLGTLLGDGLSYKESFVIRCYEVGVNRTATVETFANLLQVTVLQFL